MRKAAIITLPKLPYVDFHHQNIPVSGQATLHLHTLGLESTANSWLRQKEPAQPFCYGQHDEPPKEIKTTINGSRAKLIRFSDKTCLLKILKENTEYWFPLAFQTQLFPTEDMLEDIVGALQNIQLGPTNESQNVWQHQQFYRPYVLHQNPLSTQDLSKWAALTNVVRDKITSLIPSQQEGFFSILLIGRQILADQTLSKPKIVFDGLSDKIDIQTEDWLTTLNGLLFENNMFSFKSLIYGGGHGRCSANIILKTGPNTPRSSAHEMFQILKEPLLIKHINQIT